MTASEDVRLQWDDGWKGWVIKDVGPDRVLVLPMIFNDRIVIGPRDDWCYEHGWCYDKGGAAILAALAWNPETEDTPAGFKKQTTPGRRKAPHG